MKFRRKPTIVEAEQFREGEPLPFAPRNVVQCFEHSDGHYVQTMGEHVTVHFGDWIILEHPDDPNDDRAYPCDPDVFVKTYEPVEETE